MTLSLVVLSTEKSFKTFMFQILFDSLQALSVMEGTPTALCQRRGMDFSFSSAKG